MQTAPAELNPFPTVSEIEGIVVAGFPDPASLFERVVHESHRAGQSVVHYLNVHVANNAYAHPRLKQILQESDLVYCDGAGIVAAAHLLGNPLPTRLTAADWFIDMLASFADKNCSVYLLGGEPGVPESALEKIAAQVPNHTIVGMHHGYIASAPEVEQRVIHEINRLKPDILIVGFGTPLQEYWIDDHRHKLNVPVIYAIGAVMDFISGRVSRCPRWMGDAGYEWLYRLWVEPERLGVRYLLGNPWFFSRMLMQFLSQRLSQWTVIVGRRQPVASKPIQH